MKLVAIINVTPDSFSGDGETDTAAIVEKAKYAVENGAAVLDVGGESTRPGSEPITAKEEQRRVIPAIQAIKSALPDVLISIDSYRVETSEAALKAGASILNDINGGDDVGMLQLAAKNNCRIILMHNLAKNRQVVADSYVADVLPLTAGGDDDYIPQLKAELNTIAERALKFGVKKQNIILDPGIGFGKTVEQNLAIITHASHIKQLGYPVLIGASRKSFIGKITGAAVENRLPGSLACAANVAVQQVDYLRIHDIAETYQFLKMQSLLNG